MESVASILNMLTKNIDKKNKNYEQLLLLVAVLTARLQEKYKGKQVKVSDLKEQLENSKEQLRKLNITYDDVNEEAYLKKMSDDKDKYNHPGEYLSDGSFCLFMKDIDTIVDECWAEKSTKKVFAFGGNSINLEPPPNIVEMKLKYTHELNENTVQGATEALDHQFLINSDNGIKSITPKNFENEASDLLKNLPNEPFKDSSSYDDVDYARVDSAMQHPSYATKRKFNSLVTDFCVNNFFADKKSRLRYIDLIQQTFFRMINRIANDLQALDVDKKKKLILGSNITLLLKGGIVIRLILKNLFRDLYSELYDELTMDYKKELKIGDFDFEMLVIKKKLREVGIDPTEFKNQLDICTYAVMCRLNKFLEQNKRHYFNYFLLDDIAKEEKITMLKAAMNKEINGIKNDDELNFYKFYEVTNITSVNRKGFALLRNVGIYGGLNKDVVVDKTEEAKVFKIMDKEDLFDAYKLPEAKKLSKIESSFYSTHNPVISFASFGNFVMFTLNRIKYNLEVTFSPKRGIGLPPSFKKVTRPIVGEILDLSHPFEEDRRGHMESDLINGNKYYQPINFANSDYNFHSLSSRGLSIDLSDIIFTETDYKPWKDRKYGKRLKRVIALAIVLSTQEKSFYNKTFIERIEIFEHLRDLVKNNFTTTTLTLDFDETTIFKRLYEDLRIVSKKSKDEYEKAEYKEYQKETIRIFDKIIYILKLHWNKTRKAFLTSSDIESGILNIDFHNLYE